MPFAVILTTNTPMTCSSLAETGDTFWPRPCNITMARNIFHLFSNVLCIRCFLLQYQQLTQPYLSLVMHFVTMIMPMCNIDSKGHKSELNSSRNY